MINIIKTDVSRHQTLAHHEDEVWISERLKTAKKNKRWSSNAPLLTNKVNIFVLFHKPCSFQVLIKYGSKNNNNKLPKYRKLGVEMLSVTVLANKKGLWISLRPEQSVKGTVGSP